MKIIKRGINMSKEIYFPEIILNLPEADIPIEGLHAYLFQGENQQFVFMAFEKDEEVSEHIHEAQWGIVLDGEIKLIIDGKDYTFKKGDSYFIPKGVKHSAKIKKGYKDLTLFNQKDRYKIKEV
jgi:quercetin dioxygenase-like cupin family protein